MKNNKTIMIVFFVLLAFQGMAQKKLPLQFKVGDKWYNEVKRICTQEDIDEAGVSETVRTENILGSTYEVLVVGNGTYDIKLTFNSLKFEATFPGSGSDEKVLFDSGKQEDLDSENGEKVSLMIGKSFVFTIDANSHKLISIKERPEKLDETLQPKAVEPMVAMFSENDEQLTKEVESIFGGKIPEGKLTTGTKWDKTTTDTNGPISKVSNNSYTINHVDGGKMYIDGASKITIDGILIDSQETGKVIMSGNFKGTGAVVADEKSCILSESKSAISGEQNITSTKGMRKTSKSTISFNQTFTKK